MADPCGSRGGDAPGAVPSSGGRFAELLAALDPGKPVVIQTHDYPDIDAVASAWGLAELVRARGFRACVAHRGSIRFRSLRRLVEALGIELAAGCPAGPASQLVAIDGSPANGNVTLFEGRLVGVVDHHFPGGESGAPFVDIRPELASCSTIIACYWSEAGVSPHRGLATALLAGIQSDTDFLSRRSSLADFEAYARLFKIADWECSGRIVRSVLDLGDLGLIAQALEGATVHEGFLYANLPGASGQETLAVLADFLLRVDELRAAVVVARHEAEIHLSVRSKSPALSAFDLVRRSLAGIGQGGGHSHSAGGVVPLSSYPGDEALKSRFFAAAAAMTSEAAATAAAMTSEAAATAANTDRHESSQGR